ncbi:BlaB/IND/MUS family subclass B1 metallo-beta-lactamase [Emticicia agri]|uniref:beta-lactamase n=1 Tax=Emticicia agri TaxID=2492393 RepID=A0A4V1ZDJ0_9BACT|nr:BlaB/IND/MUS family subclass B1 metallo-beta-lactamase [Emticicia agri]RYU96330.1 BlaB/IND/MUS family subclass B1 metallo-beta-lactamase [Emticicia agri]
MKTTKLLILFSVFLVNITSLAQTKRLDIKHLTGNFYVYITYNDYKGTLYPANSMYVVTKDGVVMIDTPWDENQMLPLLDSIEKRHNKKVVMSISTHFHADRTAGLNILRAKGIKTYSSVHTYELCKKFKEQEAEYHFTKDTTFQVGEYNFKTYYPGEGHAPDNIMVCFEKDKVLYGGCFIKSTEATDVGNLSDANPIAWEKSLARSIRKYPTPKYVIPGHLSWGSNKTMQYTLELVKKYNRTKK